MVAPAGLGRTYAATVSFPWSPVETSTFDRVGVVGKLVRGRFVGCLRFGDGLVAGRRRENS